MLCFRHVEVYRTSSGYFPVHTSELYVLADATADVLFKDKLNIMFAAAAVWQNAHTARSDTLRTR